jgi:hypothetical protein
VLTELAQLLLLWLLLAMLPRVSSSSSSSSSVYCTARQHTCLAASWPAFFAASSADCWLPPSCSAFMAAVLAASEACLAATLAAPWSPFCFTTCGDSV